VQWSHGHGHKRGALVSAYRQVPWYDIPFYPPEVWRNANFVGREDILEQLKENIKGRSGKVGMIELVLYGTGGMGKTQIALQYVYRYYEDYSSVFWINGASEQSLKLGFTNIMQQLIQCHAQLSLSDNPDYTEIGRLLGMAGKPDAAEKFTVQKPAEEQHIVGAVKQWFAAKGNIRWLLVIASLDDLESFDLRDYIPQYCHGTVIITSRRPDCVRDEGGLRSCRCRTARQRICLLKVPMLDSEVLLPTVSEGSHLGNVELAANICRATSCFLNCTET